MMAGSWLDGGGNGSQVDPHEIVTPQVLKGVLSLVEAGALVSLGTTSDGGALGFTVTVDGKWRREYVRSADELLTVLAIAVPEVTDLLAVRQPSPVRDRRARGRRNA